MIDREAKRELFDSFATVGKAVSSGRRVELLDVLANGPRSVEKLASELGLSVANTSQHLQVLRRAGLVATQRRGTTVVYRTASPEVFGFMAALRELASDRVAEVDRLAKAYLGAEASVPRIGRLDLSRRLQEGEEIVIVDVRPPEEFAAGHLPGAVSIPLEDLPRRMPELPKDKDIVAYCRGRYCAYAHVAVRLLLERGYRAVRLEEGLPEWSAEQLPVEREPS